MKEMRNKGWWPAEYLPITFFTNMKEVAYKYGNALYNTPYMPCIYLAEQPIGYRTPVRTSSRKTANVPYRISFN